MLVGREIVVDGGDYVVFVYLASVLMNVWLPLVEIPRYTQPVDGLRPSGACRCSR